MIVWMNSPPLPQMLLSDFTHHHVEMACTLLETCGRFLFRSPDSHLRTSVLLVSPSSVLNSSRLDYVNDLLELWFSIIVARVHV